MVPKPASIHFATLPVSRVPARRPEPGHAHTKYKSLATRMTKLAAKRGPR